VYFSGWKKIEEFFRTQGIEGLRKLYRGKIKIEDLAVMDRMEDVEWKVRYVPEWMAVESP